MMAQEAQHHETRKGQTDGQSGVDGLGIKRAPGRRVRMYEGTQGGRMLHYGGRRALTAVQTETGEETNPGPLRG